MAWDVPRRGQNRVECEDMEEFFTVPKLMEIGLDTLSAATGLFVVAVALRVASAFTLSAHRRALRLLAAAAVVVVASEVVRMAPRSRSQAG